MQIAKLGEPQWQERLLASIVIPKDTALHRESSQSSNSVSWMTSLNVEYWSQITFELGALTPARVPAQPRHPARSWGRSSHSAALTWRVVAGRSTCCTALQYRAGPRVAPVEQENALNVSLLNCRCQATAKGPFGLRVKLPPAQLSSTHAGASHCPFLLLSIEQGSSEINSLRMRWHGCYISQL